MQISYKPPGAVAEDFHRSDAFVRGLKGPIGSGKSTCCCIEILTRALAQQPGPDNVRRSRSIVCRNTYPELKSTTIKTWMDWFGDICTMRWDAPITGTIDIHLPDGTRLWHEVIFLAIDRPDDVGKLKSLEATFAWMNEASEMEKAVLDLLTGRVGRFPAKRNGGPTWTGVLMDTNPPDDDHWWYKLDETREAGFEFFHQPGGLVKVSDPLSPQFGEWVPNPAAENVENLPGGFEYYMRQRAGKTEDYIKVMLGGQYGSTMTGKPVYNEWNDKVHLSEKPLPIVPGLPITIGLDFGLTPAAIIGQLVPGGAANILREHVSEGTGIRQFYTEVIRPAVLAEFSGHRIEFVGDPAGANRSQNDAKSAYEELLELGVVAEPAHSNAFHARKDAVSYFLTTMAIGRPAFQLDPSCKILRKGFNGGYHYDRVLVGGSTSRYKDTPAKDKYSHPHDALQYLCMKLRGNANPVRAKEIRTASMNGWI